MFLKNKILVIFSILLLAVLFLATLNFIRARHATASNSLINNLRLPVSTNQ
jgi:hypothetical protein